MKFCDRHDTDFHRLVRARVRSYFEAHGISKYGNRGVLLKAALLVSTTLGLYALILSNPSLARPCCWPPSCFGVSSILTAFNLAHDAAHNALTPNRRLNAVIYFLTFNLQGANAALWKLRHIGSHHVFPNVQGGDADLDDNGLLRMSASTPWRWYYRYQHLYAPLLYMLFSLHWIFVYDVQFLFKKQPGQPPRHPPLPGRGRLPGPGQGDLSDPDASPSRWRVLDVPWWQVILGFVADAPDRLAGLRLLADLHALLRGGGLPGGGRGRLRRGVLGLAPACDLAGLLPEQPAGQLPAGWVQRPRRPPPVPGRLPRPLRRDLAGSSRPRRRELGVRYNELPYRAAIRSHFRFLKRMGAAPTPSSATAGRRRDALATASSTSGEAVGEPPGPVGW